MSLPAMAHSPETYGPSTTCYNRFVRRRRAGIWDQIMEALAAGHDAAVQMIDSAGGRGCNQPVLARRLLLCTMAGSPLDQRD
jgi:transposase